MCYICDDEVPRAQIIEHVEECKEQWNVDELDKPEEDRIPLPDEPEEFVQAIAELLYSKKRRKEVRQDADPQSAPPEKNELASCPNCTRTFFPERLASHLKSCKPGKPLKPKGAASALSGPRKSLGANQRAAPSPSASFTSHKQNATQRREEERKREMSKEEDQQEEGPVEAEEEEEGYESSEGFNDYQEERPSPSPAKRLPPKKVAP